MQRDDGAQRPQTEPKQAHNTSQAPQSNALQIPQRAKEREHELAKGASASGGAEHGAKTLADQDEQIRAANKEQRRKARQQRPLGKINKHLAKDAKAVGKYDKLLHNPVTQAVLHPIKTAGALVDKGQIFLSHLGTMIAHGFTHIAHSAGALFGGFVSKIATALAASFSSHALVTGASVMLLGLGSISYGVYHFLKGDGDDYLACLTQPMNSADAEGAGAKGQVGGDWTKQGTPAYQTAQTVWNFWKDKGFSGAAIAGILGNIAREGGFSIPDRAQGHYSDDEDKAGISKGVYPDGGGGGLYQFTPFTKFAPLKSSKWLDVSAQNNFVWDSEVSHAGWKNQYAHMNDVSGAAHEWFNRYERGAAFDPTKVPAAQQAYQLFGGANVKANDSLLGADSGTVRSAGTNDMLAQNAAAQDCGNGTGNTDLPDGTGSVAEQPPKSGGMLSYDFHSLPNDLKQYVPDPTKVGLSWGSRSGWTQEGGGGGQCPDFSVSYFHHIWTPNPPGTCGGNGKDIASNMAKAMGGSVSNTPHAGAIASVPPNVAGISPGQWGHTFVVVHVLGNGDIILLQQNFVHSGDNVGKKNTWEVGLCSKQEYQDNHFQFFTPDTHKYKLNMG